MKVVINRCFGGFGLSDKAFEMWLKIKNKQWVEKNGGRYYTITRKKYDMLCKKSQKDHGDYRDVNGKGFILTDRDIERNDKDLVKIVEKLGVEASSRFAELEIVKIPDDIEFTIEEYDGIEWIAEKHRTWS